MRRLLSFVAVAVVGITFTACSSCCDDPCKPKCCPPKPACSPCCPKPACAPCCPKPACGCQR